LYSLLSRQTFVTVNILALQSDFHIWGKGSSAVVIIPQAGSFAEFEERPRKINIVAVAGSYRCARFNQMQFCLSLK
jgi:hypothetical protein